MKSNKYPIYLPYIHTQDNGMELRYMLRSLKHITNFNGKVTVIGDKENWFNLNHIPHKRTFGKPYLDQVKKMLIACQNAPKKFIAMMDDIYITEPTEVKVYCRGELLLDDKGYYKRTKTKTRDWLFTKELPIVDYECHTPMLVERDKLTKSLEKIIQSGKELQWRSVYGNMWNIKAEEFEDKKTKTPQLKEGHIISTNFYTSELNELFPEPSKYEL